MGFCFTLRVVRSRDVVAVPSGAAVQIFAMCPLKGIGGRHDNQRLHALCLRLVCHEQTSCQRARLYRAGRGAMGATAETWSGCAPWIAAPLSWRIRFRHVVVPETLLTGEAQICLYSSAPAQRSAVRALSFMQARRSTARLPVGKKYGTVSCQRCASVRNWDQGCVEDAFLRILRRTTSLANARYDSAPLDLTS